MTLLVSRQQVLPHRDPEVAAVLEEDFLERGVALLKGARAELGARVDGDGVVVTTEDGRRVPGTPRAARRRVRVRTARVSASTTPGSSPIGVT